MPLTFVRYDRKHRPVGQFPQEIEKRAAFDGSMSAIADALPAIIAQALTVPDNPEGTLVAEDIGIEVSPSGQFDRNVIDLSIIIFANDYPTRRANLAQRRDMIATGLKRVLPDNWNASIWIRLAYGKYVFIPKRNNDEDASA